MEGELHKIQITIADKNYPFSVNPDDEEVMRLAVKMISDRLGTYKNKYSISDNQDALAITVLQFVVQLIKERRNDQSGPVIQEIQFLNNQLDEYIKNNIK